MTPIGSLVLPIVLAAVAVFILSSIIHMAMPWHRNDYERVPNEDGVLDALRPFALAPGDYMAPKPMNMQEMGSPNYIAKRKRGPVLLMTVMPNGGTSMPTLLATWFAFTLFVAAIAGGFTGLIVPPGADHRVVMHHTMVITLISYTLGAWPLSIWYSRKWSTTFKGVLDGAIYAIATGLIFAWRWPGA